jgi:serine/threonine protein kinase
VSEPAHAGVPRILGRYALCGQIAAGGMAAIYLGRLLGGPVGFSRAVAIKRIHPWLAKDPRFVSMFVDEARRAARVRHPNVVPTLDVIARDDELYLVMDYVRGESLARLAGSAVASSRGIPHAILATIVHGALQGLHAAHEARDEQGNPLGIVHRDVSPENILVGTDGVARMIDFGVARAAGQVSATRDGHFKGKTACLAPEQLEDGHVDRRADVYAAGVVLWEMLSGKPPSAYRPGLAGGFDRVAMRALERAASARFATARDMALALEGCTTLVSPLDVGAWVEATAKEALAKRTAQLAELEANSALFSLPHMDADVPPVSSRAGAAEPAKRAAVPTRTLAAIAGALAVALLLAVAVAGTVARRTPRAIASPHPRKVWAQMSIAR